MAAVERMLRNPKGADPEGDNFIAYLRACHREIFEDVETHDATKLKRPLLELCMAFKAMFLGIFSSQRPFEGSRCGFKGHFTAFSK